MRRPAHRTHAAAGLAVVLAVLAAPGCRGRAAAPCVGVACGAACPRDAAVGGDGRCACAPGDVAVLGACVPPPVADAYCGGAARATGPAHACAYPVCGPGEVDDVDAGCVDLAAVSHGGPKACARGALVVEGRRFVCVPSEAACPQGSHARPPRPRDAAGGDAGEAPAALVPCDHPPSCPPGTLPASGACRPVVLRGGRAGAGPVIDLGAWAALVLGTDGGPGTPDLCRPLQRHPFEVGLTPGESVELRLVLALRVPDQDVSAVHADVSLKSPSRPLPPAASALAEKALRALVEPLRGLGGQASTSALEVEVRCLVASL